MKEGKKGIPHSFRLEMAEFKQSLYGDNFSHTVEVNSLRLDKDKRMTRTKLKKKGLSDIHLKLGVLEDRISCLPLKIDNQYI